MTAALPVQRRFRFFDESRPAVLARMDVVKYLLHCDEDHVLYLIEDRQLVAFDLAMSDAEKRTPGVWTSSIRRYEEAHRTFQGGDAAPPCQFDDDATSVAIAEILPAKQMIGLTELKKILGVTATHIHHLIEAGLLTGRGGDTVSKAPQITRASIVRFLEGRRL